MASRTLDMALGVQQLNAGPGAAAVDQFLRFQHNSLAETLPDKSLE